MCNDSIPKSPKPGDNSAAFQMPPPAVAAHVSTRRRSPSAYIYMYMCLPAYMNTHSPIRQDLDQDAPMRVTAGPQLHRAGRETRENGRWSGKPPPVCSGPRIRSPPVRTARRSASATCARCCTIICAGHTGGPSRSVLAASRTAAGVPFAELQKHHDEDTKSGDAAWGPDGRLGTYAGVVVQGVHDETATTIRSLQVFTTQK